ncbi:HAD family hydrolase [Streptomyces sp. NPDC059340]|uniref:HAD family hydrolase n=1 Tax=Streptomyces sp. NPDC059340 TaxID=3346806 RepID=UPI0036985D10
MNQAGALLDAGPPQRHLQGIQREFGAHVGGKLPSDGSSASTRTKATQTQPDQVRIQVDGQEPGGLRGLFRRRADVGRLDVPPERAVYVGDSPTDMTAARAAGVVALGAVWGWHPPAALRAVGADHLLPEPASIGPSLLHHLPPIRQRVTQPAHYSGGAPLRAPLCTSALRGHRRMRVMRRRAPGVELDH